MGSTRLPPPPSSAPPPSMGGSAPPAPSGAPRNPRSTIPAAIAPKALESGVMHAAGRLFIYGPGGIGKSTLASFLPGPYFIDLQTGSRRLEIAKRDVETFDLPSLRGRLAWILSAKPEGVASVVIDTVGDVERFAVDHVCATRPVGSTPGSPAADSIESYGWGKGWQYVYDEFVGVMADLSRLHEAGYNVVLIGHEVTSPKVNPAGEDYIRYEPLLYPGDKRGKGSIRELVFTWCDHVLFVAYDVAVTQKGKGIGSGSRSIYAREMPTHRAKTRSACDVVDFTLDDPAKVWREIGILPG